MAPVTEQASVHSSKPNSTSTRPSASCVCLSASAQAAPKSLRPPLSPPLLAGDPLGPRAHARVLGQVLRLHLRRCACLQGLAGRTPARAQLGSASA